jgi:hypothetical protein
MIASALQSTHTCMLWLVVEPGCRNYSSGLIAVLFGVDTGCRSLSGLIPVLFGVDTRCWNYSGLIPALGKLARNVKGLGFAMVSGRDHSWSVFGADMTTSLFAPTRLWRLGGAADRAVARLLDAGTEAELGPKAALEIDVGRPCRPSLRSGRLLSQLCVVLWLPSTHLVLALGRNFSSPTGTAKALTQSCITIQRWSSNVSISNSNTGLI